MAAAAPAGEAEKLAGNAHFKAGEYLKAAASYTKAIKADPSNHVLFSNRAQAFLKINKVSKALEDADKCIALAPDFVKGYHRKALALAALERKAEAIEFASRACEMDPTNRELLQFGASLDSVAFASKVAAYKAKAAAHAAAADPAAAAEAQKPVSGGKSAPAAPAEDAAPKAKKLTNLTPEEFASEVIRTTLADLLEAKTLEPRIYMQPSPPHAKTRGSGGGKDAGALGIMQISKAFDSPETLAQCIPAVRAAVNKQFGAQAAALAVLKSSISCPRIWQGKGRRWPFDEGCEGIFMQLEHPRGRSMWFTLIEDKATMKIGETVSLDPNDFQILPKFYE